MIIFGLTWPHYNYVSCPRAISSERYGSPFTDEVLFCFVDFFIIIFLLHVEGKKTDTQFAACRVCQLTLGEDVLVVWRVELHQSLWEAIVPNYESDVWRKKNEQIKH
jgi:hypothetical protein